MRERERERKVEGYVCLRFQIRPLVIQFYVISSSFVPKAYSFEDKAHNRGWGELNE
jgi:hypothetical protein